MSGIKPTYGRCSRWGIVSFASSLDQAGPMARDVRDCAIMLQNMAGFDAKDATSLDLPVPDWEAALSGDLKGKKVGIPGEYRLDGIDPDIDAMRSEEHTSELQSLMRISDAVFCLKKKKNH